MISAKEMLLSEYFRPKELTEFEFNRNMHLQALKWLKNWNLGEKFMVISGPPGIGKTSFIYCISRIYGYKVTEINSSTEKNSETIKRIMFLSNAVTINQEKPLILIEELEDSKCDYSFTRELFQKMRLVKCPLIFCCNQIYETSLKSFKLSIFHIPLSLSKINVKNILIDRLFKSDISIDEETIDKLIENSRDLRNLFNLIQLIHNKRTSFKKAQSLVTLTGRKNVYQVVESIFTKKIQEDRFKGNYYNKLDNSYEQVKDKLFSLSFHNYLRYINFGQNVLEISTVNNIFDTSTYEYHFLILDIYSRNCIKIKDVNIETPHFSKSTQLFTNVYQKKIPFDFNNHNSKRFIVNMIHNNMELFPYMFQFIGNHEKNKGNRILKHMKEFILVYKNEMDLFESSYLSYIKYIKNSKLMNVSFAIDREFRYIYKESTTASAIIDIGIDKLFKN